MDPRPLCELVVATHTRTRRAAINKPRARGGQNARGTHLLPPPLDRHAFPEQDKPVPQPPDAIATSAGRTPRAAGVAPTCRCCFPVVAASAARAATKRAAGCNHVCRARGQRRQGRGGQEARRAEAPQVGVQARRARAGRAVVWRLRHRVGRLRGRGRLLSGGAGPQPVLVVVRRREQREEGPQERRRRGRWLRRWRTLQP